MKDNFGLKGTVNLILRDSDGKVKQHKTIRNLVVNTGLYHIVGRMLDAGSRDDGANTLAGQISHMAIGEGTTAVSATQTALVNENCTRRDLTASGRDTVEGIFHKDASDNDVQATAYTGSSRSDATKIQYIGLFSAGNGTGAVTEAGLFDTGTEDATGVDQQMLCRTKFDVINKASTDSLQITWTLEFADGSA